MDGDAGMQYIPRIDYTTASEISLSIGVSEKTVIRWIRQGRLPYFKPGRQYLIPLDAYEQFKREHSSPSVQEQQNDGRVEDEDGIVAAPAGGMPQSA